jgi:hypothetical protein
MEWFERMKTKISIDKLYEMRNGTKWTVTEKRTDDAFLIEKDKPTDGSIDTSMHKSFIVGAFGNFGFYPNPFDLVRRIS